MDMDAMMEYLQGMGHGAVLIRLILATVCGSLIGWERVVRRHSAGIRTFALVSLGSAVATALNLYLASLGGMSADVSRIPAGVVSGIGFLGAGSIIVTGRNQIKGLTTAASLWVTACMGMAFGAGYTTVGASCFFLVMVANLILRKISLKVEANSRFISLYVEVEELRDVKRLKERFKELGCEIVSMNKIRDKSSSDSDTMLMIELDFGRRYSHPAFLKEMGDLEFVDFIEEV